MTHIFLFFILLCLGIYSSTNGYFLLDQRKEYPNAEEEKTLNSKVQTRQEIKFGSPTTKARRHNETEYYTVVSEEDASMKNRSRNKKLERDNFFAKDEVKMTFELYRIQQKANESRSNDRSEQSVLAPTREKTRTSLLAQYITGTKSDRMQNGLLDDFDVKKRLGENKMNVFLQDIKHWFSRRHGYFDTLASSILKK